MTTSSDSKILSFNGQPVEVGQIVYQLFEKDLNIQLMRGTIVEIKEPNILKLKQTTRKGNVISNNEWETPANRVHTNSIALLESWLQGKHYEAHYKLPAHIQLLNKYLEEEIANQMNKTEIDDNTLI